MPGETKFGGWAQVIAAVKEPIGIFALAGIVVAALSTAGTMIVTDMPNWTPFVLFALWFIGFLMVIFLRPGLLLGKSEREKGHGYITVSLGFPEGVNPAEIDFDGNKCNLKIMDRLNQEKVSYSPNLSDAGEGGWSFQISSSVESTDTVRLLLVETNGRKWKATSFCPLHKSVILKEVVQGGRP